MRVITGTARGRRLKEPLDYSVRPTTDKVKESIFNIIQFDLEGRRVLDLFAGTGQLGIEARSRGAAHVVFVDSSTASLRLIRDNIKIAGFNTGVSVVPSDAQSFLKTGERFDIIFLDPPYDSTLLENSLIDICRFDILKENGIIVCESKLDKEMPDLSEEGDIPVTEEDLFS